jgi:hypothetical protein
VERSETQGLSRRRMDFSRVARSLSLGTPKA